MIPRTKTESMVRFWSWLKKMSTQGIMQWINLRQKLKVSLSSSVTNPPASRRVVGSNFPDGFKTLDDVSFVLKHRVYGMDMEIPSYCACSWESVCHHFIKYTGSLTRKKKKNPARSEKNWLTNGMWDVTCCMIKAAEGDKEDEYLKSWKVRRLKNEDARASDKTGTVCSLKFRLKINIAAYGGIAGVLIALGLQQPKL